MAHQQQQRRLTLRADVDHRAPKSQKISPASYKRYTVAWICALPKELTAAKVVLDEVHEPLPRWKNDTNSYVLGSIGSHNIVITSLPTKEYGTNNAVNVLTNLTRTFESIYLSLMVGIGGGVPRENFDIRLGDIIVGTRVIQHDLGKIVGDGQIQHTAVPRTLAHMVGKALSLLQAEHQPHSSRIPLILQERFRDHPGYAHPSTADRLFSPGYPHDAQVSSCDGCNPSALVQRSERSTKSPYIHYGTIASGNQVIKSSTVRDTVAQAVDAICFEMEAAGLSDICPCLSIRGVCDYSDSHKSKEWQGYAAATAAAFAREFLEKLPPTEEVLSSTPDQDYWLQNEKYNQFLRDLRETDPRDDKTRIEETKGGLLKDAYRWILGNNKFKEWHNASHSHLLWIKGDPGKGKTMLLCGLINELEIEHKIFLSYFFCQATEARLSNATGVLRGLIFLLVVQRPPLFSYVEEKYDHAGKQLFEDGNAWQALSKIFMAMLEDPILGDAILMVDALDECITDQENLLDLIVRSSNVKWIVTSRNWPEIEQFLDRSTQKVRLHLELNQEAICKAVEAFIEYKVEQLAETKQYDVELRSDVKNYLAANADGTFLWVALVCQGLADSKVIRKRHTRVSLESFPKGLDSLYGRLMEYISSSYDAGLCREILALASAVYRPVTLTELKTLLGSKYEDEYDDLPEIINGCGSFLTLRRDAIYFLHQSAKDFLLSKASHQILPSGLAYQHELVFERSLETLSQTLRRNICQLDHPGIGINQIPPNDLKRLDPIRYACVHWVDHLHDSKSNSLKNYLDNNGDIQIFFQKKYLYWLEALSLLRSTVEGVKAIYKLEDLAARSEAPEPVMKLLQDARRFILIHMRPIEIAPLQVYVSALVFSPEHSLIRELFKHEDPDWISPKPKMEKNWSNCLQTLEGHGDEVTSVALSPDNQLIASGGRDKTVRIWDIVTGVCQHTLKDHDDEIHSVAFLPYKQSLVVASNTIKIWDTKTGFCRRTLEGHHEPAKSLASSPDGQYLASGSSDQTIKIWCSKTGKCLKTLEGHSDAVSSLAFSPDSQYLVSGSTFNAVKIWDMKTFSCLKSLQIWEDAVLSMAFSPDSRQFASVTEHCMIKIWDAAIGSSLPINEFPTDSGLAIAFSPDGKRLVSGGMTSKIEFFDAETGAILRTLKDGGSHIRSIVFTTDGQYLVSGSENGSVKIWAVSIDAYPLTVEDHEERVNSIAISADGLRAVSGSQDGTAKIWDTGTGRCLQMLEGHRGSIDCVTFSADSKRLASCSTSLSASGLFDNTIKVWDALTGACLHTFEDEGHVLSAAFSADGQYLASSSTGETVKIWNVATGECLLRFGHNIVYSVAFSADCRYLAMGSIDIRIWDIRQQTFKALQGHVTRVSSVAFSGDSKYLASGSVDGEIRIWDLVQLMCLQTFRVSGTLERLSFDLGTNSQLYTDTGILDLAVLSPMPNINAELIAKAVSPGSDSFGHRISIDGEWIMKGGENALWLPSEYRPVVSAVFGSTVAIGCESGRVLIVGFS